MSRSNFEVLVSCMVARQKHVPVDIHGSCMIQLEDLRQKNAVYIPGHVRGIAINIANGFLERGAPVLLVAGEIELLLSENLAHPPVIMSKGIKIITGQRDHIRGYILEARHKLPVSTAQRSANEFFVIRPGPQRRGSDGGHVEQCFRAR